MFMDVSTSWLVARSRFDEYSYLDGNAKACQYCPLYSRLETPSRHTFVDLFLLHWKLKNLVNGARITVVKRSEVAGAFTYVGASHRKAMPSRHRWKAADFELCR
jgi:hypothetical protein